jgi:drug/metabolite transporter (DMT)-like permease
MRFVFLALMCVFAGIHAARSVTVTGTGRPADFWDTAGGLFFSIAASLMFVLVAVGSRTGVKYQAYYVLILVGLCLSLASDILLAFAGAAGGAGFITIIKQALNRRGLFGATEYPAGILRLPDYVFMLRQAPYIQARSIHTQRSRGMTWRVLHCWPLSRARLYTIKSGIYS